MTQDTTTPSCSKCIAPLGDQLVRALDGAFHPECFTCWVNQLYTTIYMKEVKSKTTYFILNK